MGARSGVRCAGSKICRFLTGQGRYVDDFAWPGTAARRGAALAACACGDRADRHRGGARDAAACSASSPTPICDADGIGPLPCIAQVGTVEPMIVPPRHALARDRVRHVGDPVALVVAETARPGARRRRADRRSTYRPLPAVVDAAAALAAGAPLLWDEAPGNLCPTGSNAATRRRSRRPLPRRRISSRSSWSTTAWSSAPIEPRAAIGTL